MLKIVDYGDNFWDIYKRNPKKVVAYGAGSSLQKKYSDLPELDMICDVQSERIKEIRGMKVESPEELKKYAEEIYIIVCIKNIQVYNEVCETLREYNVKGLIFHLYNNVGFGNNFWATANSYFWTEKKEPIKINIVCQDGGWIFKKFADRMLECLLTKKVDASISLDSRPDVDINHHIPYVAYKPYKNDTLMITHVDNMKKIQLLKCQLQVAGMGVCMSKDTMNKLASYGIPRNKLCFINPAQDNKISPHKYLIGITHKCHDSEDVRKRAVALLEVLEGVNPIYFKFFIMGAGWNKIVYAMEEKGFEVEYYEEFDYEKYNKMMQLIDYFLYMGFDEGTMGYLDALAAGAGTIVTPQGYHLDVDVPIDYPCSTVKQFREAFLDLQNKREKRIKAVEDWTWESYTQKHLEIWNYLLQRKPITELYNNQLIYEDGIFSAMITDNRV